MYKVSLNLKSFDLENLVQCQFYLVSVLKFLNLDQIKHQVRQKKYKKITVCRSPHIDKKSREQFQIITHRKTLVCRIQNSSVFLLVIEILKNIKFGGVELELVIDYSTF